MIFIRFKSITKNPDDVWWRKFIRIKESCWFSSSIYILIRNRIQRKNHCDSLNPNKTGNFLCVLYFDHEMRWRIKIQGFLKNIFLNFIIRCEPKIEVSCNIRATFLRKCQFVSHRMCTSVQVTNICNKYCVTCTKL